MVHLIFSYKTKFVIYFSRKSLTKRYFFIHSKLPSCWATGPWSIISAKLKKFSKFFTYFFTFMRYSGHPCIFLLDRCLCIVFTESQCSFVHLGHTTFFSSDTISTYTHHYIIFVKLVQFSFFDTS